MIILLLAALGCSIDTPSGFGSWRFILGSVVMSTYRV